nr:PREDICTED: vascular cell adhesion protein 1 isoform X1 [Latimeria chalumnae]XP_006009122.1 PREDICTED: vascular cell adhesion protein 1 isoform X1 [Latimeria chalumnae]|eukprot:XP_006009121.1 PREDICTED: vascular cell adhesion protein 1 isoform X1 [Latimeria chalumnae]
MKSVKFTEAFTVCLLLRLVSRWPVSSTEVSVYPENPVVEYGATLTLNCTTTCSSIQLLMWETQMDPKPTKENGMRWTHITSENFTKWDATPSCLVNCADGGIHQEIKKVNIIVYKFENVTIDAVPVLEVNKPYNLTCRIPAIAPIKNLMVTILRNGVSVSVTTFHNTSKAAMAPPPVTYTITPRVSDDGVSYTCWAQLNLIFVDFGVLNSFSTVILRTYDFPESPKIHAPRTVEWNKSANAMCAVHNVFPPAKFKLILRYNETEMSTAITTNSSSVFATATFTPGLFGSGKLDCTAALDIGKTENKTSTKTINVYAFLEYPIIMAPRVIEVNEVSNVLCQVHNVFPSENMTVIMKYQGKETNMTRIQATPRMTMQRGTFIPRTTGEGILECIAELVLGNLTVTKNSSRSIHVYAFPEDPQISTSNALEVNETAIVTCTVPNVLPSTNMSVFIQYEEMELSVTTTKNQSYVHAEATFLPPAAGPGKLQCIAVLDLNERNLTKSSSQTVEGYVLPQPTISFLDTKAGDSVTITCSASRSEPPDVTLTLRERGKPSVLESKTGDGVSLSHTFVAQKDDGGTEFTCEAKLTVMEDTVRKNVTKKLNVFYPPEISINFPDHVKIVEGNRHVFTCEFRGNPIPHVNWTKDRRHVGEGKDYIITSITKNDTGFYQCEGSNRYGEDGCNFTVAVEYKPKDVLISVYPETIHKADNVTLRCSSDSDPAPTYEWILPTTENVHFSENNKTVFIKEATSKHEGSYECHVTNLHGKDISRHSIHVKDLEHVTVVAIISAGVALVAALGGGIGHVYYKSQRSGEYQIQNAKSKGAKSKEIPDPEKCSDEVPLTIQRK